MNTISIFTGMPPSSDPMFPTQSIEGIAILVGENGELRPWPAPKNLEELEAMIVTYLICGVNASAIWMSQADKSILDSSH